MTSGLTMTKNIIFAEIPGYKQFPSHEILRIAAENAEIHSVVDETSAINLVDNLDNITAFVTNAPLFKLLKKFRKNHPKTATILLTDFPMEQYSQLLAGEEDILLDHIISTCISTEWTINELRITLQKIIREDIFGLEKYLSSGTKIYQTIITSSEDREVCNYQVMQLAEQASLSQHIAKTVFGITEEMLMNAIYDAPIHEGIQHYQDLPRTTKVDLKPHEYPTLYFGFDKKVFGIATCDPFGALRKNKLYQYLKKVLKRHEALSIIDTKKGGAGLGLFKILYGCHALICNVSEGKKTEIIALIDIENQIRDFGKMSRSIHFFE